ncbi:hypothetical protein D0865_12797 [Hortaea werneckii]|uniref:Uncharacterized protein n=1 Tax=Hortaea werneckii TaxID=91943 RepID=A0A3M7BIA0_HORWE|nr:hypothetical protein D0865_12797 [Hortaea werneckii]
MSLIQRVTSIEGTDRQPPQLPEDWLSPTLSPHRQTNGYGTINNNYAPPPHREWPQHSLRGKGSVRSLRHVISYDALSHHGEASQAIHPTGGKAAYKVATYKRFAQVVFTVIACWLASGIVFGFAALKPVLISEGVYRELCTPEELEADVEVCYAQDLRMNFFLCGSIYYL